MKKTSAADFYLKISLWTFFCLILAGVCCELRAVDAAFERRENEVFALRTMQQLRQLQSQYAAKHNGEYAPNFDELTKTVYIDEHFRGEKPASNGYGFEMRVSLATDSQAAFYSITADPLKSEESEETSLRHFYFNSKLGAIKANEENRQANADDPSI